MRKFFDREVRARGGLLALLAVLGAAAGAGAAPPPKSIEVDCDKGKTIAKALESDASPLEIVVKGHCQESVRIDRDWVSLAGSAGARITGVDPTAAAVTVDGAQNVLLSGLAIENGAGHGVMVTRGGAARLAGVNANANARHGILVMDHGSATISDANCSDNGGDGIGVWAASQVVVRGAVRCDRNGRIGVIVSGSSFTAAGGAGASLDLHDNGSAGLFMQLAASGQVGMPLAASGSVEGVGVYDGSALGIGGFSSRDNSWSGVTLWNGGVLESGGGTAVLEDNLHGLWIEDHSSFFRGSATSFAGNDDAAIYVENSNVVLRWATSDGDNGAGFVVRNGSAEFTRATLDDRLDLSFGTRVEGGNNTRIPRVDCDGTVISQLDRPCGHTESGAGAARARTRPARPARRTLEP